MLQQHTLFSVVIPTYNRAGRLAICLDSLLNQTYKHFEVLICDDGSTDHTKEIVDDFILRGLNIHYIYMENWGGPARPRNTGIAAANGEWICFLDSDDTWHPDKLAVCATFLNGYDVLYHDFYIEVQSGISKSMKFRQVPEDAFRDLLVNGNTIATSGTCIRKEVLIAMQGFSEDRDLIAVEDYDLWLRIAKAGYKFRHIPIKLGNYWTDGGNITAKNNKQIVRINTVYARHLEALSPKDKTKAEKIIAYKLAKVYEQMGDRKNALKNYRKSLLAEKLDIKLKSVFFILKNLIGL